MRNYFILMILVGTICTPVGVQAQKKKSGGQPKDTIHVVGHAHMDMNWLWTYSETMKTKQSCNPS